MTRSLLTAVPFALGYLAGWVITTVESWLVTQNRQGCSDA